jgi:GTPase SAR1 family protein
MQLILSHVNPMQDLRIVWTTPEKTLAPEVTTKLEQVAFEQDVHHSPGKVIHVESTDFVHFIFYIQSEMARTGVEKLMLSAQLELHENAHVFEKYFEATIKKLREVADFDQALYISSGIANARRSEIYKHVADILAECYFEVFTQALYKRPGLAGITILGCGSVGKSAIVHRLVHGEFTTSCGPDCTFRLLSPQILTLTLEEIDFQVYDICGHKDLEKYMESPAFQPNGLVYVVDATNDLYATQKDVREFHRWMDYFFANFQKNIPKSTPVLILINKTDLNPEFDIHMIENQYEPQKFHVKYAAYPVSSLTGDGLEESFRWLLKNMHYTTYVGLEVSPE